MRSGSVHLAVARTVTWLLFSASVAALRERVLEQIDEEADPAADPDDRILYARTVATGWIVLALACGLAMIGLAFLGDTLGGSSGRTRGAAAGIGGVFFCVSGALYASMRMLLAYRLRRIVRRRGSDSPEAARAGRRVTLRNTSLVGQTLVAAIVIVLAAGG